MRINTHHAAAGLDPVSHARPRSWQAFAGFVENLTILGRFAFGLDYRAVRQR